MQVEGTAIALYNRPMLVKERITFLGAGNMTESLLRGLLVGKIVPADHLMVSDILPERSAQLEKQFSVQVGKDNREAAAWAQIIVYAVEPQVLDQVLQETSHHLQTDSLIISVAAGYPINRVAAHLHATFPIVRAMPNTPSSIQEGVTALAMGPNLSESDRHTAQIIFESVGQVVVLEEKHMDAVTGLSGSGPAYIYVMIEALADAGVNMGLPRDIAQQLAAQTLLGAARMVMETGEHPGHLKDRVTSPGGTTIAGIHALERGGFRATLMNAVEAATKRSRELGESTSS